jgi:hypothetical protein
VEGEGDETGLTCSGALLVFVTVGFQFWRMGWHDSDHSRFAKLSTEAPKQAGLE